MATVTFNVVGLSEFLAAHTVEILGPRAEEIRARQAALCPRDSHATRHLADNIRTNTAHIGAGSETVIDIGPAAEFWWARALEAGGATNRKPRPFVRPSVH